MVHVFYEKAEIFIKVIAKTLLEKTKRNTSHVNETYVLVY